VTVVINPYVHKHIKKETREGFLERVSCVEYIRTRTDSSGCDGLSLYIGSQNNYEQFRDIKLAVSKGDFTGLDSRTYGYVFGIDIPDKLYDWMLKNDIDLIYRQVFCWLAALYASDPGMRYVMLEQIYPPVFEEVLKIYEEYFSEYVESEEEYSIRTGKEEFLTWEEEQVHSKVLKEVYKKACKDYYGSLPPDIISNPFSLSSHEDWMLGNGASDRFNVTITKFWFTPIDWKNIVLNEVQDNLARCESVKHYWEKWRHQFSAFESTNNHHFSLFNGNQKKGYVYLINQRNTSVYKIGFTTDQKIEKRLKGLQTGNAAVLDITGYFQCSGVKTEGNVHKLFSSQRLQGEWFELENKDVYNILDEKWRILNNIF